VRPFAERRAARIARLEASADKLRKEGESRLGAAHRIADSIPMGQPILRGHHSERRARKDQERIHTNMRKGIDALNEADAADRRIAAAESNAAVSSDDPEAVQKLSAELVELEAERDRWKAIWAAMRKTTKGDVGAVDALNLTPRERSTIKHSGGAIT